jgi:hypothetical protein
LVEFPPPASEVGRDAIDCIGFAIVFDISLLHFAQKCVSHSSALVIPRRAKSDHRP